MCIKCPYCPRQDIEASENQISVVRNGHFRRKNLSTPIQRFYCRKCKKSFSDATNEFYYWQKKRDIYWSIFSLLSGGFSQRRTAFFLNINRKTLVRKFIQIGKLSLHALSIFNTKFDKVSSLEFDDLETFEHSKCKPLSCTIAVESETRRILAFRVAQMPAKGLLTHLALKKYGPRADHRAEKRRCLFKELQGFLVPGAKIKSDQNPHYTNDVKEFFPESYHDTFKGRRGCVVGQGELKAGGFDPLFTLNHTYAMFRANINRLFRRTWCTTKLPERLNYHLAIYSVYHNLVLLNLNPPKKELNPLLSI